MKNDIIWYYDISKMPKIDEKPFLVADAVMGVLWATYSNDPEYADMDDGIVYNQPMTGDYVDGVVPYAWAEFEMPKAPEPVEKWSVN